ncbi:hypothetical protein F2Q68_00045031 [Brassica cretica]|uniref:YABBY N-terminal domain-containing protein n=1 Tax=Brassica cretica TaxID=69181 RepID=A0A8S9LRU3_BRACR|nr:hypothetical protein F2Q68_00045031 [Brassica cretica]
MSMSSMSSPSSAVFSPEHLSPSEHLCYVQCNFCETILAVSVPYTSLFKTVTVRCGCCANLLSVNMRSLVLPASNQIQLQLGPQSYFTPQNILWAHFPHIHFGLMPDNQPVKKTNMPQQAGEENMGMKEGFYAPAANVGMTPY